MCRVLLPGGLLVVTVPNRLWRFSATVAAAFHWRPYEGLEHWVGWGGVRATLREMEMRLLSMEGFHLFPPVIRTTWPLLTRLDRYGKRLGPVMLNIAVKAAKPLAASGTDGAVTMGIDRAGNVRA